MITPSIGRVVWYVPPHAPEGEPANDPQPHAALVTYVWSDRMVNLAAFMPNGASYGLTSVTLVQEGDAIPVLGGYAEWMPYQVGQAKKHADPAPALDTVTPTVAPLVSLQGNAWDKNQNHINAFTRN